MRKNTKQIEIAEVTTVPGTFIGMIVMKDGTRYFRQHNLTHARPEDYPGEARNIVGIMSSRFFWKDPDQSLKYARVWYNKSAYIHEDDLRSYILERQGSIENKQMLRAEGRVPYWSVEAAKAIKAMFGIAVTTNGRHERVTAPKEIAKAFEGNKKLRRLYRADMAIKRGMQLQRTLANYWPDLVHLQEDLQAWKLEQKGA